MPDPITSPQFQSLISFLLSAPITHDEKEARALFEWCRSVSKETFAAYAEAVKKNDHHAMLYHANMALALSFAAEAVKAATHYAITNSLPPLPDPDATAFCAAYGI